jgi:hypothetical protein
MMQLNVPVKNNSLYLCLIQFVSNILITLRKFIASP